MTEFPPARQRGLAVHFILASLLSLVSFVALWLTFQTEVGFLFAIYVLIFVATAVPVPILAYRAYALTRANYFLDRNTLRLVWGLRIEDIPVTDVEWIRPLEGLLAPVGLPWFRLPGGILGVSRQPDIGKVEFLASEAKAIVLVSTARQIFAISPEDPGAFLAAFQKITEMGSLQSIQGHSQFPSFVAVRAWDDLLARYLWLTGIFLNVGLLVWVTVFIPSLKRVSLGFGPTGAAITPVSGAQLILLPLLSALLFTIGWLSGLFFYRKDEQRALALIVWASGVVSALFFLVAVFFILTTPI